MTNLQMVQSLCQIIEELIRLVDRLYLRLAEESEITNIEDSALTAIKREYEAISGQDEFLGRRHNDEYED